MNKIAKRLYVPYIILIAAGIVFAVLMKAPLFPFYVIGAAVMLFALTGREQILRAIKINSSMIKAYKIITVSITGIFWLVTLARLDFLKKVDLAPISLLSGIASEIDQYLFLVVLGLIFIGVYFVQTKDDITEKAPEVSSVLTSKFEKFALAATLIVFLALGLAELSKFMSVDEPKWLFNRVPQLITAVQTGEWKDTLINDKPGVLPAALSGILISREAIQAANAENMESVLFWWRLPVLLVSVLALSAVFFLSRRLFSTRVSLLALVFIATNPTIFTISQVVNPDALLWGGAVLALLCFATGIQTGSNKYQVAAVTMQTLALLSKFTAAINFLIFFIYAILDFFLDKKKDVSDLVRNFRILLFNIVGTITLFGIIFPYNWITLAHIAKGTIAIGFLQTAYPIIFLVVLLLVIDLLLFSGKGIMFLRKNSFTYLAMKAVPALLVILMLFTVFNQLVGERVVDVTYLLKNAQLLSLNLAEIATINITIFTLGIPLLVLLGYVIFNFSLIWWEQKIQNRPYALLVSVNIVFIAYLLATGLKDTIANMRYQVMFLPMIAFMAAAGWDSLSFPNKSKKYIYSAITVISWAVLIATPFPWVFSNILNFRQVPIQQPWGFGGYYVAQYLNSLPDVENTVIWVDTEGITEFYKGPSLWRGTDNPFDQTKITPDYFVLSDRGFQVLTMPVERGGVPFYAELISTTPLLQYYQKAPHKRICLDRAERICYRVVKNDYASQ